MSIGSESSGGRPVATINVTPMADVIITLLIIFMVMTPMFGQDDHVRLPAAENAGQLHGEDELLLRVRDDGSVLLGDRRIDTLGLLAVELRDRRELLSKRPRPVRLEADAGLDYARVARVLDACREAGARELVLVTRSREIP
jgi:biopolymer transport protein ExbD